MIHLRPDTIRKVLCLGAHADDVEIGCGGTILQLAAERSDLEVTWVVFSGAGERVAEAESSAEAFLRGVAKHRIVLESFRDSYFPFQGAEIKECVERIRRETDPDLIFTHRRNDLHQDHRLIAELTSCAWRNHLILEYEIPKYDGDLGSPNAFVRLDEQLARRKVELLEKHFHSQCSKPWFTADTFLGLMRLRGIECNSPGRYAEGFFARKLVL